MQELVAMLPFLLPVALFGIYAVSKVRAENERLADPEYQRRARLIALCREKLAPLKAKRTALQQTMESAPRQVRVITYRIAADADQSGATQADRRESASCEEEILSWERTEQNLEGENR